MDNIRRPIIEKTRERKARKASYINSPSYRADDSPIAILIGWLVVFAIMSAVWVAIIVTGVMQ